MSISTIVGRLVTLDIRYDLVLTSSNVVNPISGNKEGEKKAFYIASLISDHHNIQIIVTKNPGEYSFILSFSLAL